MSDKVTFKQRRDRALVRRGFRADAVGEEIIDNYIREVDRELGIVPVEGPRFGGRVVRAYVPAAGELLDHALTSALAVAQFCGETCVLTFEGATVEVEPTDTLFDVAQRWALRRGGR
jgi:hypothetical protein